MVRCMATCLVFNENLTLVQRPFDCYTKTSAMIKGLTFTAPLLAILYSAQGQTITRLDQSKLSFAAADSKITSLMKAAHVTGAAITVFNHGDIVYKKTFGYKNLKTKEPIRSSTNFYGA